MEGVYDTGISLPKHSLHFLEIVLASARSTSTQGGDGMAMAHA